MYANHVGCAHEIIKQLDKVDKENKVQAASRRKKKPTEELKIWLKREQVPTLGNKKKKKKEGVRKTASPQCIALASGSSMPQVNRARTVGVVPCHPSISQQQ